MIKFVLGSFLRALAESTQRKVTNEDIYKAVFSFFDQNFEFGYTSKLVSNIFNCKGNLPLHLNDAVRKADIKLLPLHFENELLTLLSGNKLRQCILAIADLIACDNGILPNVEVDLLGKITKAELSSRQEFRTAEFLAGVMLYALQQENSFADWKVAECVNEAFLARFTNRANELKLFSLSDGAMQTKHGNGILSRSVSGMNTDILWLLDLQNGTCFRCQTLLGGRCKNSESSKIFSVVSLPISADYSPSHDVLICDKCLPDIDNWSSHDIVDAGKRLESLEKDKSISNIALDVSLPDGIEQIVRKISAHRNAPTLQSTKRTELKAIDKKIKEPSLRNDINSDMARMYAAVNEAFSNLASENVYIESAFISKMQNLYETVWHEVQKADTETPQEDIFEVLNERISREVGIHDKKACKILLGYLVKRCDVFHENAKQG